MASSSSRKALLWSAFFIAWLFVPSVLADYCSMPGIGQAVKSKHVIDGDTLDLADGRRVRLIGINAPEIGRQGNLSEPYAQAARKGLQQLVSNADLRLLVGEETKDRYGRTLGHLFDAQGDNLEARLLSRGLGFAVAIPPNLLLLDCHLEHERQARSRLQGVWRESPVGRAAQVDAAGFQVIHGRVTRVSRAGKYLWVDMDGPLVLRLPGKLLAVGEGEAWQGRELEVRGWVVDRGVQRGRARYMLPVPEQRLISLD